jgi:hypothetical protein
MVLGLTSIIRAVFRIRPPNFCSLMKASLLKSVEYISVAKSQLFFSA